ncbi:MAG: hypothetical protein LUC90_09565 [Lachnospiraceae bacterium]|nr:hypothetical protein [Lachnospiraceae bacterium]
MDNEKPDTMEKTQAGTIYDAVYRTLTVSCSRLLLPVLNEVFGESYTGEEFVDFSLNEHFMNRQDGKQDKRVTDTSFTVYGSEKKKYLFECQSRPDSSILIRFFEYSTQIALDDGKVVGDVLEVEIPHCAILYLRSWKSTPDRLQIRMNTPGGSVAFEVHALKLQEYTIEEIFEKKLFMLVPFYIFTYEKHFGEYNTDEEKLNKLQAEYAGIVTCLDRLVEQRQLSSYEKSMIIDLSKKVLEGIAARYEKVRKGVREVFGGKIIETDTLRIYRAGETDTKRRTSFKLYDLGMKEADIARVLEVSVSKVEEWLSAATVTA